MTDEANPALADVKHKIKTKFAVIRYLTAALLALISLGSFVQSEIIYGIIFALIAFFIWPDRLL